MNLRLLCWIGVGCLVLAGGGCEPGGGEELENPNQPRDLGPPWVNKTTSQWGSSVVSSDAEQNRVFSADTDDFGGLVESVAAEYGRPIAVKPQEMLQWNLTVEVKGKNQDEVLADLAEKCRLTLGASSSGIPLLTFPGKEASPEFVVNPEGEEAGEGEAEDESY